MTTLTFAFSRALARTWSPGDRIVVSGLDHDANVTPWVMAAADRGVDVDFAEIDTTDMSLDLDHLEGS
jgi:selenocysteine lyase/cysteine desulfurase